MILVLMGIGFIILGIVLCIVTDKLNYCSLWYDFIENSMCASFVVGVLMTIIVGIGAIVNVIFVDIEYEDKLVEKQMIEYRIEQSENLAGNELLYTQIVEFNEDLRHTKRWVKNPWTSWLNNWKVAEINYIEVEGVHNE